MRLGRAAVSTIVRDQVSTRLAAASGFEMCTELDGYDLSTQP